MTEQNGNGQKRRAVDSEFATRVAESHVTKLVNTFITSVVLPAIGGFALWLIFQVYTDMRATDQQLAAGIKETAKTATDNTRLIDVISERLVALRDRVDSHDRRLNRRAADPGVAR